MIGKPGLPALRGANAGGLLHGILQRLVQLDLGLQYITLSDQRLTLLGARTGNLFLEIGEAGLVLV